MMICVSFINQEDRIAGGYNNDKCCAVRVQLEGLRFEKYSGNRRIPTSNSSGYSMKKNEEKLPKNLIFTWSLHWHMIFFYNLWYTNFQNSMWDFLSEWSSIDEVYYCFSNLLNNTEKTIGVLVEVLTDHSDGWNLRKFLTWMFSR